MMGLNPSFPQPFPIKICHYLTPIRNTYTRKNPSPGKNNNAKRYLRVSPKVPRSCFQSSLLTQRCLSTHFHCVNSKFYVSPCTNTNTSPLSTSTIQSDGG